MTTTADRQTAVSDYFRLDDDLSPEETGIRDKVRAFAEQRVLPIINDYWEKAEFPAELLPPLAELGIIGTIIQGYGCPGMSRKAAGMVAREMARADGSLNTFLGVHSNLCMGALNLLASDQQKGRWLPALARIDKTGAFALTEPDHGSDSIALETSARRDGDSWVINGHKRWIGNGHAADVIVLFARNTEDGNVNAFVVEKDDAGRYPAGYSPTVITGKVGKRAILQADILIEDMRVPAANRLEGCRSFRDVSRVLQATRGGAAWEAVGHAMAVFEIAADYAQTRIQFGKPIASYQLVQSRLANMLSELTTMQLLCTRMAELADRGHLTNSQASMVKMATAQKGKWICNEARDLLGGNGLLLENHIIRHMTDMEVVSTYEGTDSMQALIVGRDITGISAFN
ncbi:acyl-coenzyme A oxidase 4, peroxisomal [Pseudarthrobacter siccitolerans]|uniref:Acyl-coenzyme A oxidase 4, peroxisomal n=1 Tax=Pseudarthrobacter siccitolerans TaxID=861266 RepID=A0A024H1W1_9MICC|nr:acyl-CoA dehydrogenase family protein [Pseudarthrobacter siccitolerans]CCQ46180.1 acyl-coenzyme A oxidase 4, peroxisomal [Pseudarthrobacter siccitolerans]